MALIGSLAALPGAAIFCLACAGLGSQILRRAFEQENALERLLCSTALGVICYETAVGILEFFLRPRLAVSFALATLLVSGAWGLREAVMLLGDLARRARAGSRGEQLLAASTAALLLFEVFAATA